MGLIALDAQNSGPYPRASLDGFGLVAVNLAAARRDGHQLIICSTPMQLLRVNSLLLLVFLTIHFFHFRRSGLMLLDFASVGRRHFFTFINAFLTFQVTERVLATRGAA